MKCSNGLTLIETVVVILIIVIIAAITIPGMIFSGRCANERSGSSSLKTLATAEVDFRSNDRDGNRVNDYWTGDVAGLYCLVLYTYDIAKGAFVEGSMVKLIDPSTAGAEAFTQPKGAVTYSIGGIFKYEIDYSKLPPRVPKGGLWYYALDGDNSTGTIEDYQVITDGAPGAMVHNLKGFGFGAFPDSYGVGRSLYMRFFWKCCG